MHEEMCTHLRGAIWAQSTNQPPWIQIFSTQPCICIIFSVGISVKSRKLVRAHASDKECAYLLSKTHILHTHPPIFTAIRGGSDQGI